MKKLVKENLNEAVKHLSGRSKKEIDKGIQDLLKQLLFSDDAEELKYYLENIYENNYKQLIIDLIDEGIDPSDILVSIVDDLDLDNTPETETSKKRFMDYRRNVMKMMYRLIEKNKNKINLDDLL